MEIKLTIFGKDFSPISFEPYSSSNQLGIKSLSYEMLGNELCKIIASKFLVKMNTKFRKYVQRNTDRTREKDLVFYEKDYEGNIIRFGNIVGVLTDLHFTLAEDDLRDFELDNESVAKITENVFNIKLQISSRFDGENTYFLPTLLYHHIPTFSQYTVPSSMDDVFNFLLVYWFKHQLIDAYILGPYRVYAHFEKNDSRLKGAINIAKHIKLNAGQNNGKIAYGYRENTADNMLNYLIIHAYMHILKFYPELGEKILLQDHMFMKIINELLGLADSMHLCNLNQVIRYCNRSIAHPYYHLYNKLRETSLMLIKHQGISMFNGDEDEVQGILFYISDLWELYLEDVLKEKIEIKSQCEEKVYGCKHATYPDFLVMSKNQPIMILDAKYKRGWTDYYLKENCDLNDYTKCIRDMNTINAHATGVIFPTNNTSIVLKDEYMRHNISAKNRYDRFFSIPFMVPPTDGKDYYQWKKEYDGQANIILDFVVQFAREEQGRQEILSSILDKIQDISSLNEKEKESLIGLLNKSD